MNIRVRLLLLVFAVWLPAALGFGILGRSICLRETASVRERVQEYGRTLNPLIERELDKRAPRVVTDASDVFFAPQGPVSPVPVVVATGYSAQALASVEVLNKPYDVQALLEALDRAAAMRREEKAP